MEVGQGGPVVGSAFSLEDSFERDNTESGKLRVIKPKEGGLH